MNHGDDLPDPSCSADCPWPISRQLLLTVNGVCAILLLVFVIHDYRREVKRRLGDKRVALREEAAVMLAGVRSLTHHGTDGVQHYVDDACARMEEKHSPGHHIVVRFGDLVMQAKAHGRSSDELLQAVERAANEPGYRTHFGGRELIVGAAQDRNLSVYVSEYIDQIQASVVRDSLRRLGGSLALAVIAAVIVNFVLLRIVVRPLDRLVAVVTEVGTGKFGREAGGFRSRELCQLASAVNRMSRRLAASEQQRQAQLRKAREIQQHLLPDSLAVPGAVVAVRYEPAESVGGDLYDVRQLEDGSWVVFLADVTGHGIPAAMNATLLKAQLALACERLTDAVEIMHHINTRFTQLTLAGDFATAVLLRFIPGERTLQVVNAGHDAALYRYSSGRVRECKSTGLLLGVDESAEWEVDELETGQGDRVLVYTDGVTETFNAGREMFGRQRVIDLVSESSAETPQAALETLTVRISEYRGASEQLDDVTAVLIQF